MHVLQLAILMSCLFLAHAELCKKDYVSSYMFLTNKERTRNKGFCEKCMQKYNVTFETLDAVEKLEVDDVPHSTKCYFKCYYEEIGTSDDKNHLRFNYLEDVTTKETLDAVKVCAVDWTPEVEPCKGAYDVYVCMLKILAKKE